MVNPYDSEKIIFQIITWKLQFVKLCLPSLALFTFEFGATAVKHTERGPKKTNYKATGCNRSLALKHESQRLLCFRNIAL